MIIRLLQDAGQVKAAREALQVLSGGRHPLLSAVDFYHYRGASVFVAEEGRPLALIAANIGKRAMKGWGPYVNMYLNFTAPPFRRQGLTRALYDHVVTVGLGFGCTRLKSLAGTPGGALFQLSAGLDFWGRKESGELLTDTQIRGDNVQRRPPLPMSFSPKPMTRHAVLREIKAGMPHRD